MNREFIPYEQALALKELGFDEPVFGEHQVSPSTFGTRLVLLQDEDDDETYDDFVLAPLYQQAFRWFRDKHHMWILINQETSNGWWSYQILDTVDPVYHHQINDNGYETYEEAELDCLNEMIKIVKEGKHE